MKSYDVTALGELLIDFAENGISGQGNPMMEANPGGAPCNVLAMPGRPGHKTAFIGKVGQDMFGNQLEAALEEVGIDTRGLKWDEQVHTTLAFVHTLPDGDREFSFYRNPGADMMLSGSGMSSSAAYEVLIGTIFSGLYHDTKLDPVFLAQVGRYAENVYFGKPCGLMDQMACSVGGLIKIDFADPREPVVKQAQWYFRRNFCVG